MLEIKTVTNGPTSKCVQRVCHDTLPRLISFSLDEIHNTFTRILRIFLSTLR